ncbi:MAG TPA: hypothetical protein VLX28_12960 [Thermoanaerobaculia bacterium]|nr:hypothetical protein [Thermoanaerobaculia bacterium]
MSSRLIAALLLLTLGFGVPAQAKPPAAGAAFPRQGGVLEELTAYGATLLLALKDGGLCGQGYCPTPPPPPPPIHIMSIVAVQPRPVGKGS